MVLCLGLPRRRAASTRREADNNNPDSASSFLAKRALCDLDVIAIYQLNA